jgi:phenylacetate-CoA ligase
LDAAILNNDNNYQRVTDLINKFKPLAIDGYTSSIYHLSRYLQENKMPRYRPQVVFTTAENLFPYQQKTIEQALAPVSDIYGCGEINGIAVRPVQTDKYYIIEPHVVVETEYHRDTRLHEIIVTDLDNRVMPFIRYKPGDFIDRIHINNDCNNDYETLKFDYFTKIQGRDCDIIQLKNGKKVSAVTIVGGAALREIPGIMKHKVVWDGDCLHFVLETNEHFNVNLAAQKIKRSLNSAKYGHDMNFKIETVNQLLPDKSGKFKYFESKVIEP